jgi:hypothetical protein
MPMVVAMPYLGLAILAAAALFLARVRKGRRMQACGILLGIGSIVAAVLLANGSARLGEVAVVLTASLFSIGLLVAGSIRAAHDHE